MANSRANRLYAPEFRRQIVEPVRSGRNPQELAREFEPSAQAIRNWVAQVDRDEGRTDGLTTAERDKSCRGCDGKIASSSWSARSCQKPRLRCRQGDRLDPIQGFEFVGAHQAAYPVVTQCRVLGGLQQWLFMRG